MKRSSAKLRLNFPILISTLSSFLILGANAPEPATARQFIAQNMADDDDGPPVAPSPRRNSRDIDGGDSGDSAQSGTHKPPKLFVPAFVTYWSHDALGYHPSIALTVENSSGANLLGEPIQLQAHFRLLSEGILTIYRWQTYFDTIGGQQQVNTEAHGKRPFELPLDQADWPLIECKILCKIGDAPSEDAQNLLVARVRPVALSDEDARTELNFLLGRARLNKAKLEQQKKKFQQEHPNAPTFNSSTGLTQNPKKAKPTGTATSGNNQGQNKVNQNSGVTAGAPNSPNSSNSSHHGSGNNSANTAANASPPSQPEKALVATAQTLGGTSVSGSVEQFFTRTMPGLGEDFYQFEKTYGMPYRTDVKDKNWIWAAYRKHPAVRVMAGSRGRTGKSDVVVAVVNDDSLSDQEVLTYARALSGKFKSEKNSELDHSVRYTQDGRIELTAFTTQSYRAIYFKTVDPDNGDKLCLIAVSRLPGSLSELLKEEGYKTDLLKLSLKGLGEGANQNAQTAPDSKQNLDDN